MHCDTEPLLVAFLNADRVMETNYYQTNIEAKLHLTVNAPGFTAPNNTMSVGSGNEGCIFQSQKKDFKWEII